jgi:PASTA domain-containing protein/glucodextranase-like protein
MPTARRLPLAAVVLCALAGGGCGGDTPAAAPVRLQVTAPQDEAVVHDSQVELRGTVRPSTATVMVDGRRAAVSGGAFRATVGLRPGTNVVDVMASAGDARPALTAIRVRLRVTVDVPDVTGLVTDDASAQLKALGLKVQVDDQDGIFERLLPGKPQVCATDPQAGTTVDPGTSVRLLVSKQC